MTNTLPEWRSVLYFILPHPTDTKILVQQDGDSWCLPCIERNEFIWMPDIGPVIPEIAALLGQRVTVLYAPYYVIHRQPEKWIDAIYFVENLNQDAALPVGMAWIGRKQLSAISNETHRGIVDNIIAELEGNPVATLLPTWSQRGWFADAETWMLEQLMEMGYQAKSSVELVRTWGISCVLRADTDHGRVYFKVASALPLFSHEPKLMQGLSGEHPDLIPAPLAINVNRRWMLLPDLGPSLGTTQDKTIHEETLHALASLQIAYINRIDDLIAFGCLDRKLERLTMHIDPLFSDDANLGPLSEDEKSFLRTLAPRLKALIVELDKQPIPPTLIHGDLNVGNVAIGSGHPRFFDWTDGAISHPFFDLITLLDEMVPAENGKDIETQLLNVYFEHWTQFASLDQLHKIWKIAEPLSSLHQAVSYQYIARTLEGTSKQEITGGTAYFLRKLLKCFASPQAPETK